GRTSTATAPARAAAGGAHLLHGRVTTVDGKVYEGRLRFGADEEALWGNYFNGQREANPWLAQVPHHQTPRNRLSREVFGVVLAVEPRASVERPFMTRFGDITRIEARGSDLWVTLKSGTVAHLDRYAADDYADGVRVWDRTHGVVDLGDRKIRSIEFLPVADRASGPDPLHGT